MAASCVGLVEGNGSNDRLEGVSHCAIVTTCDSPEPHLHEIQDVQTASNEETLHDESVQAILLEDVEISGDKDDAIEKLSLE